MNGECNKTLILEIIKMAVADIVVTGIDNCFESSKMVRYTILLIFPAMMLELLAFSVVGWSVSDESSQGLWKHCYNSRNNSLCCQDIEDKFDDIPAWFTATQTFQVIAYVFQVIGMFLIIPFTCITTTIESFTAYMFVLVPIIITAVSLMISVIIYATNYQSPSWLPDHHLYVSFAGALIACILYTVAGVLLSIFGINKYLRSSGLATSTDVAGSQVQVQQTRHRNTCIVCKFKPRAMICLDCGHIACCEECSRNVMNGNKQCPDCRKQLRECKRYMFS